MALIDLTSPSLLQSGVDLFYGKIDFRSKDNAADNPTHNPIEFAAREAAEWIVRRFRHRDHSLLDVNNLQ